jgi:transcriptional regulator with XRE-family HTH domain
MLFQPNDERKSEMNEETLGKQLQRARKKKYLSQAALAEKIGVAKFSIHRWEHDKAIPAYYARRRLVKLLEIDDEIFLQAEQQRENQQFFAPELQETSLEEMERLLEDFKVYRGWRELVEVEEGVQTRQTRVTVNGEPLPYFALGPGGQLRDPVKENLYEWGYGGEGPRNLALSILADYFGEREDPHDRWKSYQSVHYHVDFKNDLIACLPHGDLDEWQITTIEITQWLRKQSGGDELYGLS